MQKIILIVILFTTSLNIATAKTDSLPPTDSLFASLRAYHIAQNTSHATEYQITEKKAWMKYLPSVGIGYALTTRNGQLTQRLRPNVSFNVSQVYNALNDKEIRRAKIKSIELQNNIDFKTDSLNLLIAIQRLAIARGASDELIAAQSIDDELFAYSQRNYDEKKISTYQFLTEKRQYFERKERMNAKLEQTRIFEIEVLRACKW